MSARIRAALRLVAQLTIIAGLVLVGTVVGQPSLAIAKFFGTGEAYTVGQQLFSNRLLRKNLKPAFIGLLSVEDNITSRIVALENRFSSPSGQKMTSALENLKNIAVTPCAAEVAPVLRNCLAKELSSAVLAAVRARSSKRLGDPDGPPFTLSSFSNVHPCVRSTGRAWSARRDVLYIVMGSSIKKDRANAVRLTWAQNADNVLIYSDKNEPLAGMKTLPQLENKTTYEDAQHRALQGLKHALSNPVFAALPWVMLVDDDSWVNVRELSSFLHGWDPEAPFLCGHVWNHPKWEPRFTWPSGGAGMLFTRAAARILSEAIYTPVCPFLSYNDITIGRCAWTTGIALVHSPLFDPESVHLNEGSMFRKFADEGSIRSALVIHRASPERMVEMQETVDRFPDDALLAEGRI